MWPFSRKGADEVPATVERRLADAESTLRTLKTEWYDVLDRLERMAGRLAKRAERERPVLTAPEARDGPQEAPVVTGAMANVLKRRAPRGVLPTGGG